MSSTDTQVAAQAAAPEAPVVEASGLDEAPIDETVRYAVQLGATLTVFHVLDGVVVDSGARSHRWAIGKAWRTEVAPWLVSRGAKGKRLERYQPPSAGSPDMAALAASEADVSAAGLAE